MSGAWEILEARRKRALVVVITPPDPKVTLRWANMLRKTALPTAECQWMFTGGMPYGPARNQALVTALEGGFNWLAFLDSDTLPPPNWILKLMETQRDFVSALYHHKDAPYYPVAKNFRIVEGKLEVLQLQPFAQGEIIPVDFLPTGALLISRRCMEAVRRKYPRPFEWGLDVARVPGDNGLLPSVSEDYMYSLRAKELGFQPWLHTGIVAAHELPAIATAKGIEVAPLMMDNA